MWGQMGEFGVRSLSLSILFFLYLCSCIAELLKLTDMLGVTRTKHVAMSRDDRWVVLFYKGNDTKHTCIFTPPNTSPAYLHKQNIHSVYIIATCHLSIYHQCKIRAWKEYLMTYRSDRTVTCVVLAMRHGLKTLRTPAKTWLQQG